jgi:hypothetical protein
MRLAKFIVSILMLLAVLYFGFSPGFRVCAQGAYFTCDCYLPNSGKYGIICGDECLYSENYCDVPKDTSRMKIAK